MLYLRLAHGGGIVQVYEAEAAAIEEDDLVLRSARGAVICRFERLDVLAYSSDRALIEKEGAGES